MGIERDNRRVALVVAKLSAGGAERQALELARGLVAGGWLPVVVCAERADPAEAAALRRAGIPVHSLNARLGRPKWSLLFWLEIVRLVLRMRSIFRRERVRIVQSFLFWQNVLAVRAAMGLPGVCGIITGRRNLGRFKDDRPYYQKIEDWSNRHTDLIVCNARAVARDVLRRERVDRRRVVVVHNGIDTGRYTSAAPVDLRALHPELRDARFIVGTVGNMKRQKRHDVFLRALAAARMRVEGLKGVIVGGDLGEEKALRRLAGELGLEGHLVFTGRVEDTSPYYPAMDVFVLSSDFEGLPNALMEAMAAGRPCVATDAGGVSEIIRQEAHGFVVPPGNPEALADRIVWLLKSPERAATIGRTAAEWIAFKFHTRRMVRRYIRLYESLS